MLNCTKDTRIPTSLRRQAASRANGAKSHGPVTAEGKARSSQNAVTHGLFAKTLTLTPEDEELFNGIYENYEARFEPRDQVEYDLLHQVVFANFQLHQVWAQEVSLLGMQMSFDKEKVDTLWRDPSEMDRRALAFVASIKDSNALNLFHRYARSYANQAERALKLLLEMKKQRIPPVVAPLAPVEEPEEKNEPSPINEHPDPTTAAHPCPTPAHPCPTADLLHWIAGGATDPAQPVHAIARAAAVTVAPQTLVSDCVLAMAESRATAAALTTDGSPHTALQRIITPASLAPAFGDHPVAILREIASAPHVESLRALNHRARAWILDNLSAPLAIDWLAAFGDFVNRHILERLLHLTENDRPELLWCFYGEAGRQELLTSAAPRLAVVGSPSLSAPLESALAGCGYLSPEPAVSAGLEEWKARFSGWIRDPIRMDVYPSRPFFDLRPVYGGEVPFRALEAHIRAEIAQEPAFLRVLAHDCLSNLPPLTFFRDLVVEESGELTQTFRLAGSAVQPLADVAHVFSLAAGEPLGGSTCSRFEGARRLLPSHESIFREAADAMRVVLFHQARGGLRQRSSGDELPLPILGRHDRQVLKSCFRSIHRLLAFTASWDWLEAL